MRNLLGKVNIYVTEFRQNNQNEIWGVRYCMVQWNSTVYENYSESENPLRGA